MPLCAEKKRKVTLERRDVAFDVFQYKIRILTYPCVFGWEQRGEQVQVERLVQLQFQIVHKPSRVFQAA